MTNTLVETEALTKIYGSVVALADCSLRVAESEIFGLLGPNGSGKTTLLRLLMGHLRPTRGAARIAGLDCHRDTVRLHEEVTYMPGEARLFPTMRGRDVLRFFSDIHPRGDLDRALALADRLGIDLTRRVLFCSSGMRQKLALIIALAPPTPLVILDEPTSNLDPTARSEVLTIVREAKAAGRTVIFSSHILSEIEQTCDRACIIRVGELAHTQVMHDLRRQHRIKAKLTGTMPNVPAHLADGLTIEHLPDGRVVILTPGELSPLLGWLATLPIAEVRIEPIGLQAIYDRYHAPESE